MNAPTWGDRWRELWGGRDDDRSELVDERVPTIVDDREGPLERERGQDDDPPDLLLAVIVAIRVLLDVRNRLEDDVRNGDHDVAPALLLRIAALVSVLHRVRTRLEDES